MEWCCFLVEDVALEWCCVVEWCCFLVEELLQLLQVCFALAVLLFGEVAVLDFSDWWCCLCSCAVVFVGVGVG